MPTFLITRTYKYTATIYLDALDKWDALANADNEEEVSNKDDILCEQTVVQIED